MKNLNLLIISYADDISGGKNYLTYRIIALKDISGGNP
jgi:hypothetical protein